MTYSEKRTGGVNGIDSGATDPDAILFRQLLQVGNIRDSNSGSGFGSDLVNVVVNKPHVVKRRFDFHPHRFLPLIGLFQGNNVSSFACFWYQLGLCHSTEKSHCFLETLNAIVLATDVHLTVETVDFRVETQQDAISGGEEILQ